MQTRWLVWLVMGLGLGLVGCAWSPSAPVAGEVNFTLRQPLPTPAVQEVVPLRLAVAAVLSPRGTVEGYEPLRAYLERRLGRPVELVQGRDYAQVNALLERGEVDVGVVCTSSYLIEEERGVQALVVPQVEGRVTYQAVLLVPAASPARDLADLRGGVFAYTDPLSFTGRAVPLYWLLEMGADPRTFFARTFYTYSHDEAIAAVAEGVADGAAVDSLVYRFALAQDPGLASGCG